MLNVVNQPSSTPLPPSTPDELFSSALAHHRAGRLAEAESLYRQILVMKPDYSDAMHLLGVMACQMNNDQAAIDLIGRAIALNPRVASYHSNLGEALRKSGKVVEAEASLRKAIAVDPRFIDTYTNLAFLLFLQDRLPEAIQLLQVAIGIAPNSPKLHQTLGDVLVKQRRMEQALSAFQQSLRLNPRQPEVLHNAGIILSDLGRVEGARDLFRAIVAADPADLPARLILSDMQARLGQLNEAAMELQEVITRDPTRAEAHAKLGNIFRTGDRADLAIASYQEALRLQPDHAVAAANMAFALRDQARLSECIAILRKTLEANPGASAIRSGLIFTMHLDPTVTPAEIEHEQTRWNEMYLEPFAAERKPHGNDRTPERRMRVGYVSPDFRSHPVGRFMLPLLQNHDRTQVEVFCFSVTASPDGYTQAIATAVDHWRHVPTLGHFELADLVRKNGIDILVDLSNHTIDNRVALFALKPAPVQITYLAFCAGTGLRTMDYRLTDPHIDPPSAEEVPARFEKPLRVAETYWCYAPHEDAGAVTSLPMAMRGHVTFGSFNYFSKCNDQLLAFWARLMNEIPQSRFMLHVPAGSRQEHVRNFFGSRGVAAERLELVPRTAERAYFSRYQQVDIALDTFPWAGGTTTCDALWMGVPIITLAGKNTLTRGGLSILNNLGLADWVAHTPEEYIAKARALSGDVARLAELRAMLRERMRKSVLMDGPRFARHVEQAFRQAWRIWCETGAGK